MTLKMISALAILPAFVLSACSAHPRQVMFASIPSGAVVSVEGETCVTPCSMNLSPEEHTAVFVHPTTGEQKEATVERRVSAKDKASYIAAQGTSKALIVLSAPLLAFGLIGVGSFFFVDEEEVRIADDTEEADACPFREDVCLISLGSLVAGGILLAAGSALEDVVPSGSNESEVTVIFDQKPAMAASPASAIKMEDVVETRNPLLPKINVPKPNGGGERDKVDSSLDGSEKSAITTTSSVPAAKMEDVVETRTPLFLPKMEPKAQESPEKEKIDPITGVKTK